MGAMGKYVSQLSKFSSVSWLTVQEREAEVSKLQAALDELSNNNVAKIDRYLIKNLVVGYFSTSTDKRKEVLRIIATVLDFNREDRQKTGLESPSLWPFRTGESASGDSNQSLSQAFIKFLETESQPKAQIKIPMEEMARKHSRTSSESSTASGSNPTTTGNSNPHPQPSEMSMNLPVLSQSDRSNSILKDVLNPKS